MKFGGSSLADAACVRQVIAVVRAALPASPLVVVSAMGKTTDALFAAARLAQAGDLDRALGTAQGLAGEHSRAARELVAGGGLVPILAAIDAQEEELTTLLRGVALLRELSSRSADAIAAMGERLSSRLVAASLESAGIAATHVDARLIVRTDGSFGRAQPNTPAIRELVSAFMAPHLAPERAVVMGGYIGSTADGITTTLGRGGSDYSAALAGAALEASEVQIWTDVEGVLTCDPRVVPDAHPVPELTFAEAAELAAFGAKVLHPATIQPAVEAGIPVTVRHTHRPGGRFTTIRKEARDRSPLLALASRRGVTMLTVSSPRMLAESGFLARIFEVFGRNGVSVDLVATAEVSVSLTLDHDDPVDAVVRELVAFSDVTVTPYRAIVAVIGERLRHTPGLGARFFQALGNINVEMISMGANEINLSLVVRDEDAIEALRRLHAVVLERRGA